MKQILTILLLLVQVYQLSALDLYWRGGNGDFNDPQKWTIGSVAGATATQAPISTDNVFFVASVMNTTTPCIITINTNANCHNFWVDPLIKANSGVVFSSGTNLTLDIYGSMELAENIDFGFSGILRFRSIKNGIEKIKTAGNQLKLVQIEFYGGFNTEWVLQDSLIVDDYQHQLDNWDWNIPTGTIVLHNGTLNTNKQTIITDFFYSKNNSANRGIQFDSSQFYLRGSSIVLGFNINSNTNVLSHEGRILDSEIINIIETFNNFGSAQVFYTGNTTLNLVATTSAVSVRTQKESAPSNSVYLPNAISLGERLEFNGDETIVIGDLELMGDAELRVNDLQINGNRINYGGNLILHSRNICEINSVVIADSLITKGNCNDVVTIRPYRRSASYIQMEATEIEFCFTQRINNTGIPVLIPFCIDGGANSSRGFNAGTDLVYYWRTSAINPSDFIGNWSNPNRWTTKLTSLVESLGGCMPTFADTVVFGNMSFSPTNKGCYIDNIAFCKTFLWLDDNYMKVYNNGIYGYAYFDEKTTMHGNNTFDSLALVGGHHWYIKCGKIQSLAAKYGKIISYGNSSEFVYIESTVADQDAYIHKEYGNAFCLDYVKGKCSVLT